MVTIEIIVLSPVDLYDMHMSRTFPPAKYSIKKRPAHVSYLE